MQYYMPTRIIEDREVVRKNASLLREFGKKAVIITGKHSSKHNGSLEDTIRALESEAIAYQVYHEIEENPSVENVVSAAASCEGVDFVIGIGGGSPLDAAKAVAVLLGNPELEPMEALFGTKQRKVLPMVAIPTTAGTGSETTPYAILTLHKEQTKRNFSIKVFPEIAFMDLRYFLTMGKTTRIHTCIDAFTHLVESYLNTNANSYSDMVCEAGLTSWSKGFPGIAQEVIEEEYMQAFMQASTIAGIAISQTGTSIPHGLGYALTYHHGLSHGHANGLLTPAYLKLFAKKNPEKVRLLLNCSGFEDIAALEKVFAKLLEPIHLSKEQADRYCDEMLQNEAKLRNYPYPITKEELLRFYD